MKSELILWLILYNIRVVLFVIVFLIFRMEDGLLRDKKKINKIIDKM